MEAELKPQKVRLEDWVAMSRRTKWQWAGRVAQHDRSRWTYYTTRWQPQWHTRESKLRKQGHPKKRWHDDITRYLSSVGYDGDWYDLAIDIGRWEELCGDFIKCNW